MQERRCKCMALNQMSTLTFKGQKIKSMETEMLILKFPGYSPYHIQEKLIILQIYLQAVGCWVLILLKLKDASQTSTTAPLSQDTLLSVPLSRDKLVLAAEWERRPWLLCFIYDRHQHLLLDNVFINLVAFWSKKLKCLEGNLQSKMVVSKQTLEKGLV